MTLQDKLFSAPIEDPKTILDLGMSELPCMEQALTNILPRHRHRHLGNVCPPFFNKTQQLTPFPET